MKVKIGDTWYDSSTVAIALQVSELEQLHIATMSRDVAPNLIYASGPAECFESGDAWREWMVAGLDKPAEVV